MPVSRRRPRGRPAAVYGGQPLTLPQVTTLPATSITNTTAFLNGAVNPEGITTSWWFKWGTTTQYGSTTVATSMGSGVFPLAVGIELTGLIQGTTYHFAVVGQSAAGTVQGADGSFVAVTAPVVPIATTPLTPFGEQIVLPHFAYPFRYITAGAETGIQTVEQDSIDEVFSCVQAIVACPQGACPDLPGLGIPDPTFTQTPLPAGDVVEAITNQEPRADEQAVVSLLPDGTGGNWSMGLTTSAAGTDGT